MSEHEFAVVELMREMGGSFVKALAECFHRADPVNFVKLQIAFPEYWKEYSDRVGPMSDDSYYKDV